MSASRFKFRAFEIKTGLITPAIPYCDGGGVLNDPETIYEIVENQRSQEEIILMQSTGLLDSNGVEIYEGDIVEAQDRFSGRISFPIEWVNERSEWAAEFSYYETITVIGNIYQNPELMKERDVEIEMPGACCGALIFFNFCGWASKERLLTEMKAGASERDYEEEDANRTIFAIVSNRQGRLKENLESIGFEAIYTFKGTYIWESNPSGPAELTMMVYNQQEKGKLPIWKDE